MWCVGDRLAGAMLGRVTVRFVKHVDLWLRHRAAWSHPCAMTATRRYENIRARTLDWLLKLIDGMYKGKVGRIRVML